ncbi:coiled-coil domain-containing protein 81-like isoform X2 [Anas acuta]|uniref:coiled-coil domain-containing protein 81-like isoform X2 n=1 Tax=Anas acuta TaxID=28680 RepID=UPI0035C89508
MEGYWRVTIASDMVSQFPVLLNLSPKETEAIWDAVSEQILEALKQDKAIQVAGLGTFAVLQEQFHVKQKRLLIRKPFFQLDIDEGWLEDMYCPPEILPDDVKVEQLNYLQLAQATSFPLYMVQECVQETIVLYCCLLKNKEHVPFAFRDIGVLTCEDDFLCMKFYPDCIKRLESAEDLIAMLHSRLWPAHPTALSGETTARAIQMFPRRITASKLQRVGGQPSSSPCHFFARFHLTVRTRPEAKGSFTSQQQAEGECRIRRVSLCHPGKLLERRKLSLPTVRSWEPGTRQQDLEKKPSTSVLPPCPGSSPRTKKTDRQEAAPQAKSTSTALPTPEASQRLVQEVWNLSSQWDQTKSSWPLYQERIKQARAEMAAWEAWSQGEDRETPQVTRQYDWIPHPPDQPRSKEVVRRWRKVQIPAPEEEWRAAAKPESLQPEQVSMPRGIKCPTAAPSPSSSSCHLQTRGSCSSCTSRSSWASTWLPSWATASSSPP